MFSRIFNDEYVSFHELISSAVANVHVIENFEKSHCFFDNRGRSWPVRWCRPK